MANLIYSKIKIRHDSAVNWASANPILLAGEYGLEDDTRLLKIGDGVTTWNELRYLNKLDANYFIYNDNGEVTFSDAFTQLLDSIITTSGGQVEQLLISNAPTEPLDAVNKQYVDQAIAAAGTLKRKIVDNLPENADEHTIYMIKIEDHYEEYMFIDGAFDQIGSTSSGSTVVVPATSSTLGGVLSSNADNQIAVTQDGFMTLNRISTSLLYVPDGDDLVINGGTA